MSGFASERAACVCAKWNFCPELLFDAMELRSYGPLGFSGLARGARNRVHSALFAVRAARLRHFSLFHRGKADDRGRLRLPFGGMGFRQRRVSRDEQN